MTATTTKSGQKRLDSCALHTRRWAKIAGNPRKNTCTLHETATPVDAANAELENYGKIRQLLHKTKILGKYRFVQPRILIGRQPERLLFFYLATQ